VTDRIFFVTVNLGRRREPFWESEYPLMIEAWSQNLGIGGGQATTISRSMRPPCSAARFALIMSACRSNIVPEESIQAHGQKNTDRGYPLTLEAVIQREFSPS
jgi:hypothetical protein